VVDLDVIDLKLFIQNIYFMAFYIRFLHFLTNIRNTRKSHILSCRETLEISMTCLCTFFFKVLLLCYFNTLIFS